MFDPSVFASYICLELSTYTLCCVLSSLEHPKFRESHQEGKLDSKILLILPQHFEIPKESFIPHSFQVFHSFRGDYKSDIAWNLWIFACTCMFICLCVLKCCYFMLELLKTRDFTKSQVVGISYIYVVSHIFGIILEMRQAAKWKWLFETCVKNHK